MTKNVILKDLGPKLANVMGGDFYRLRRQLHNLEKNSESSDSAVDKLTEAIDASVALREQRLAAVPVIEFPENLPIADKRDTIAAAIRDNQVVVVAGETGSGKTTQLPKICLELGRGVRGLIGHTQPRRIAARTVADRIAEELHSTLGKEVGYQVRFTDHSGPQTYIKLMTDGILLAEVQNDRYLNKYDTIIIDEAHERSLNIDFLLGYLKTILPKRPDLKVIITSATIDVQRFSQHFDNAPVIEVSGRAFPVEVLYRPPQDRDSDDQDLSAAVVDAVEDILAAERDTKNHGGDILVFMSGEREIREAALALRKAEIKQLEVLPLYARLSLADQNKIFQNHRGRRIVLATNVAETSVTVPGIRYVIDPGTARVSRYSYRTKVQRLPIEAISQASANQRKGRCGRVSEGICIRLYSEEDFNGRPEFTDPEILRTNLGAVILQMLNMRIGDVRAFPFVDPPDSRLINDGFKLLEELQAIDKLGKLSAMGRQISRLNIDPGLARMVLAAVDLGCLDDVLIIVSALSIQDPRERPADKKQQADEQHRRFKDDHSDFVAYVNLWKYAEVQRQELSQSQWRRQSKREFLSFLRLREWRDIHHQLCLAVKDLKLRKPSGKKLAALNAEALNPESVKEKGKAQSKSKNPKTEPTDDKAADAAPSMSASYEALHRALVSGLLGRLGQHDQDREYLGARNRRFTIFPGSSQYKKRPKWVLAAELIETSQLFAHTVARVEPDWVVSAAQHLLKRSHFEPHYSARNGQVMAFEKIALYGLVLVEKQRVNFSQIDPEQSRDIFIREALVEGKYPQSRKSAGLKAAFFKHNQEMLQELHDLEAKSRRRDLLVDDDVINIFYQERIPADIVNLAGFEHWRKQAEQDQAQLLFFERESLMRHGAESITEVQFPNVLECDGLELKLSYHFEPTAVDDGVSVHVPVGALHLVPESRLQWVVAGILRDKCIAMVKALPKAVRKHFVPVPSFVDKALAAIKVENRPLADALAEQLQRHSAVVIDSAEWNFDNLDNYYLMNIKVEDERGKLIEQGRDLSVLRERYKDQLQQRLQDSGSDVEVAGIVQWDFGALEKTCQLKRAGVSIRAYPALVDEGESAAVRLQDNPLQAEMMSRKGLIRLALLNLSGPVKYLHKNLLKGKDLGLSVAAMGNRQDVIDDLLTAVVADLLPAELPREKEAFEFWLRHVDDHLAPNATSFCSLLITVLTDLVVVKKNIKGNKNALVMAFALGDIKDQLVGLIHPGCIYELGVQRWQEYPRYLKGIAVRLEKAPQNIQRDRVQIAEIKSLLEPHQLMLEKHGALAFAASPKWQEYRWLLEELRISLFAQTVKTRVPVSTKRLKKLWAELVSDLAAS